MIRAVLRWIGRAVRIGVLGSLGAVAVLRIVDPPLTSYMVVRSVRGLVTGDPVGVDQRWVPLDGMSPALVRAVIAAEDARFFRHWGIDLEAARLAWKHNARRGARALHGASTITMQCARSVFLWPARTWVRKGLEVWLTGLLELLWGKRRILEVYLNVVEWGRGVYGAEAAARHAFGTSANRLSAGQAALLAAVLPNPHAWNAAEPTSYLRARAATIERRARSVRLD